MAQDSLKCYLKSVDYEFKLIDLDNDERVNRLCKHKQVNIIICIMFKFFC